MQRNARRNAIRRKNLMVLLAAYETEHGHGYVQKFADAIGKSQSYVSQMKAGTKGIGDDTAHLIEASLKLPRGYLDRGDDTIEPRDDQEAMFVATTLALFRQGDAEARSTILDVLGKRSRSRGR